MSRDISASALSQLGTAYVRPRVFCSLDFDSGTQYVHDGIGTYTWGGHDWQGLGDFGGVDLVEEGEQASPFAVRLRLSGVDSTLATEALTGDYHLRAVVLYIGFLDENNELVDDPDLIWSGTFDVMDVIAGAQSAVAVTCESYLAKLDRTNGKLFTDAEQRKTYSADTFFSFLPQMQDLRLVWAESRAGQTGASLSGGAYRGVLPTRPFG